MFISRIFFVFVAKVGTKYVGYYHKSLVLLALPWLTVKRYCHEDVDDRHSLIIFIILADRRAPAGVLSSPHRRCRHYSRLLLVALSSTTSFKQDS